MSGRKLSVTITGPEGMLEAVAKLLRDEGYTVVAPGAAPSCAVHDGKVHGGEADELRAGLERLLDEGGVGPGAIVRLLDAVDARDSLAHRELGWAEDDALLERVLAAFREREIVSLPTELLGDITKHLASAALRAGRA